MTTPQGPDVTPIWQRTWQNATIEFERVSLELDHCHVLFVPGMLADLGVSLRWTQMAGYLDEHIAWLRHQGISCSRASIDSDAPMVANARAIAADIRRQRKPVIVIAHSKGGPDTLEALLRYPDLRPRMRALVALQCPFGGSPVADIILDRPGLRASAYLALRAISGSRRVVSELSTGHRKRYLKRHAPDIAHLLAEVPMLCLGTRAHPRPTPVADDLSGSAFLSNLVSASDLLVTPGSACLPGAPSVVLNGVDHSMTIRRSVRPFDRIRLTQTALALALNEDAAGVPRRLAEVA